MRMCDHPKRESAMTVIHRDADGTPTIWCDPCLTPIIAALNDGAVSTVASCCGHNGHGSDGEGHNRPGWVCLADGRVLIIATDLTAARALIDGGDQ